MTALVVLMRHAAHADVGVRLSGRAATPLSAAGRADAGRAAARLDGVAAVHTSPTARARETAAIVAARAGRDLVVADALDEIDFGDWAGRSFADLDPDPAWRAWNAARGTAACPGGETMAVATARAVAHIDATARAVAYTDTTAAAERPVVMVSHCDIIRGVVAHYLGLALDFVLRFDVDPGSLTTLAVGPGGGRLLTLNDRA